MEILVLGGTRFAGVHMVRTLLESGHDVTIATRGRTADPFGNRVKRICVDRTFGESIRKALGGMSFDAVCDNLSYCSNDVRNLLETVKTKRYVMASTLSVYPDFGPDMTEDGYDPLVHKLIWCSRDDFGYDEVKRQAEAALFQKYAHISSSAVRFPYIIGRDDYTDRLFFYVERVMSGTPIFIDNADERFGFISSYEAGRFSARLAEGTLTGPVNAGSSGLVSISDIFEYLRVQTGKLPVLDPSGEPGPYNGTPGYSMNTEKAQSAGYAFSGLNEWFYGLIDEYITRASSI